MVRTKENEVGVGVAVFRALRCIVAISSGLFAANMGHLAKRIRRRFARFIRAEPGLAICERAASGRIGPQNFCGLVRDRHFDPNDGLVAGGASENHCLGSIYLNFENEQRLRVYNRKRTAGRSDLLTSQRRSISSPFAEVLSPSDLTFHGRHKIDELCPAHSAMSDRACGHYPLCEIVLGLLESSQPKPIASNSSSRQAAACVPEALGWQLRVGRSCLWHRRCPCAGPITPGRALVLGPFRLLRPAQSRTKPRAIIAA